MSSPSKGSTTPLLARGSRDLAVVRLIARSGLVRTGLPLLCKYLLTYYLLLRAPVMSVRLSVWSPLTYSLIKY